MINQDLTRRLFGNEPHDGSNARVKGDYLAAQKVIVCCDECGGICGRKTGTMYRRAMQARERNGGADLCQNCYFNRRGPYREFDNAKQRFVECVQANHGLIPARAQLDDDLRAAIDRIHGGYSRFIQECRLPDDVCVKHPSEFGYWSREENVVEEAKLVQEEFDYLPSLEMMRQLELKSLANAISKSGGIVKFAQAHAEAVLVKP